MRRKTKGKHWDAVWVRMELPPGVAHLGVGVLVGTGTNFPQLPGVDVTIGTETNFPQLPGVDVTTGIKINPPRVSHWGVVAGTKSKPMTRTDVIRWVHPWEKGLERLPMIALAMVDLDCWVVNSSIARLFFLRNFAFAIELY